MVHMQRIQTTLKEKTNMRATEREDYRDAKAGDIKCVDCKFSAEKGGEWRKRMYCKLDKENPLGVGFKKTCDSAKEK